MAEYYCLITQKETKERNKIKCLIISCTEFPEDYVAQLQSNHCMEYQLVLYSLTTSDLVTQIEDLCKDKKTGYGKNWYELTDSDLAAVITAHLQKGKVVFDFTSICDVVKLTLSLTSIEGDERVHVMANNARTNLTKKYRSEALTDHVPVAPTIITKEPVSSIPSQVMTQVMSDKVVAPSVEKKQPKKEKKASSPFEIKIKKMVITDEDYRKFINECCVKNEKSKIHTIKLNDSFVEYLCSTKGYSVKDFAHPDDRETLFKGFLQLGYKATEATDRSGSTPRFHVLGLSLLKKDTTK